MANYDIGTVIGHLKVIDPRTVNGVSGISATSADEAYKIADLRARLTAIDGTYYTSAQLDKLTRKDMIYALRVHSESGGI